MRLLPLIHAWAGTLVCLLLAVVALSGSALVFKNGFVRMTVPGANVALATDPTSIAVPIANLEATKPKRQITFIALGSETLGVHQVGYKDNTGAYVDALGQPVASWAHNGRFEVWLLDLHEHLLSGDTGEIIVGIGGLLAVVMTLTGIVIWLPSLRTFNWAIIPRSSARRDLVNSHRNLGIIMALPIILMASTGASMVFADQTRWLLAKALPSELPRKAPKATAGSINWDKALEVAQTAFPDATMRLIVFPKKPTDPLTIRLRQSEEWHPNGRTLVWIDPKTSEVLGIVDALKLKPNHRVFNAIYPLHAAKLGQGGPGRIVDVATALTGLSLVALGLIGAFSFVRTLVGRPRGYFT